MTEKLIEEVIEELQRLEEWRESALTGRKKQFDNWLMRAGVCLLEHLPIILETLKERQ